MKRITVLSTLTSILTACIFIIILSSRNCDECFSLPVMMLKLFACGLVIFIWSVYYTLQYLKSEKMIFNIETIPLLETNEAVEGTPYSGEGTIQLYYDTALTAPYSHHPCVYYHSITEEQRGTGRNKKWVVIENLVDFSPFYISDSRGKLKVDPTNMDADFSGYGIETRNISVPDPNLSEIDCTRVMYQSPVHTTNASVLGILITNKRRRNEYILAPNTKIFAHGFVTKIDNMLVLREHLLHPLLISQKSKQKYIAEFYVGHALVFLAHLFVSLGFTLSLVTINYFLHIQPPTLLMLLITGNSIISGSIIFTMYNRLITLVQRAEYALFNIDVELKRRSELIPKIIELVKMYTKYEQELQILTAQLRAHTVFLSSLPEGKKIDYAPITAIIEKYPTLKAAENFRILMTSLVDTEERIAYSRAFYNRNVNKLNTLVNQFPTDLIAALFSIHSRQYVMVTNEVRPSS